MKNQWHPALPPGERLLTAAEAAEAMNVQLRFVRRLTQERRIRFVRLGDRHVRIPESAIAEFLAASTVEPVG